MDVPAPEVVFEGRTFVFAGELALRPRPIVRARGRRSWAASASVRVSRRTDYVVLGSLSADEWAQEAIGPVLDAVVQYRARGVPIAVISEEHWAEALP